MAVNDEWDSVELADAVQATDEGPKRVLVKAGLVHRPGGDGLRLALQVDYEPTLIISPAAAVRLIAALRRGLADIAAHDWIR